MKAKHIIAAIVLQALCLGAKAQLAVQSGATLSTTGGAVITLQNTDLICNGTISQAVGSGSFVFNGTANNTISGSGASIDQLLLSKTGGAKLLLGQGLGIGSSISFTSGLLDLNGNTLTLQPTALLVGENEASHIVGSAGGSVQIVNLPSNAPVALNAGNIGAAITSSQNLGLLHVSRSHVPAINPGNLTSTGIQRTFTITPDNDANLNATLRFYYFDNELNGKDENTLALWKSDDGINWSLVGADSRNTTLNYVEKSGIASLSSWTLTDANNALPITLLNFSAVCQNSATLIKWATATEVNAASFVVEKSVDANLWSMLSTVAATNNATGSVYNYTDNQPSGKAFYRLKMNDKDGSSSYSPVFSGGCNDVPMPFAVYPNPAHSSTVAHISVRQACLATIKIFNAAGQLLQSFTVPLAVGSNGVTLQTGMLVPGNYFVKATFDDGSTLNGKFLKQ
jgi:hypothetical protein